MRHVRTFEAFDSSGRRYVIHEYATVIPIGTLDDPNAAAEGMHTFRDSDGGAVNRRDDEFEIVATGVRVRER